jgi:hypothetical protein
MFLFSLRENFDELGNNNIEEKTLDARVLQGESGVKIVFLSIFITVYQKKARQKLCFECFPRFFFVDVSLMLHAFRCFNVSMREKKSSSFQFSQNHEEELSLHIFFPPTLILLKIEEIFQ